MEGLDGKPGVVIGDEISGASAEVGAEAEGLVIGAEIGDFTGVETGVVAVEGEETGELAGAKTGGIKGDGKERDKTGGVAGG